MAEHDVVELTPSVRSMWQTSRSPGRISSSIGSTTSDRRSWRGCSSTIRTCRPRMPAKIVRATQGRSGPRPSTVFRRRGPLRGADRDTTVRRPTLASPDPRVSAVSSSPKRCAASWRPMASSPSRWWSARRGRRPGIRGRAAGLRRDADHAIHTVLLVPGERDQDHVGSRHFTPSPLSGIEGPRIGIWSGRKTG